MSKVTKEKYKYAVAKLKLIVYPCFYDNNLKKKYYNRGNKLRYYNA